MDDAKDTDKEPDKISRKQSERREMSEPRVRFCFADIN